MESNQKGPDPVQILPNLFLGSQNAAENYDIFKANNIVAVVNCSKEVANFHVDKGVIYLNLSLSDSPDFHIREKFEMTHDFLDQNMDAKKVVFVHCAAGMSRSVAIVISYLMGRHDYSFASALALLLQKRPCSCPNLGLVAQLLAYEAELGRAASMTLGEYACLKYSSFFPDSMSEEERVAWIHNTRATCHGNYSLLTANLLALREGSSF